MVKNFRLAAIESDRRPKQRNLPNLFLCHWKTAF